MWAAIEPRLIDYYRLPRAGSHLVTIQSYVLVFCCSVSRI